MSAIPITQTSYQQFLSDHMLMGTRCENCDKVYLPPRPMCPQCFAASMEWSQLPKTGKLMAYTTIHIAPTAMIAAGYGRDNPYVSGLVELENGLKISAQILGLDATKPEAIQIGTDLKAEFVERNKDDEKKTFLAFRTV